MIDIYCRSRHGKKDFLCRDCEQLRDYAYLRIGNCPFMEEKSFCSSCRVHCYSGGMRDKIREVMRFSGPRLMFRRPGVVFRHLISSFKDKRSRF